MHPEESLLLVFARSPQLFETILDSLPEVLVFLKDAAGRYVWGNQLLVTRAGLTSRADLPGRTADELFPSLGASTLAQDLEVIRSARPSREILRCYRTARRDERIWCVSFKFPMFDEAGNVLGLVGLSKDLPRPDERHDSYYRLARFLSYIDDHLEENVRIADAAKHASTSMDALARVVQEVFNVTPKQLLMRKRLERACRMLENGNQTITEVSGACGYSDHSAFTRQFKATIQLTPVQYRATFRSLVSRAPQPSRPFAG